MIKPKEPIVFEGMAGIGGDVPAELIVNLGLLAHAEGQVAVLQALMGVFMDEASVATSPPRQPLRAWSRRCGSTARKR